MVLPLTGRRPILTPCSGLAGAPARKGRVPPSGGRWPLHHPDTGSHLGQDFQEMAHRKLVAIQQAYEALMGRANAK